MTKEELYAHPGWQWCTAEGAELHTLLLGLQTTFREKLEWLEDAETLALQMRFRCELPLHGRTPRPTIAAQLGRTPHLSPLLHKARRLGLPDAPAIHRLAVKRGCRHYTPPDYDPAQVADPGRHQLSDAELAIALLSAAQIYSPWHIRCAAQMLGTPGLDPTQLTRLARMERCTPILRQIAEAALRYDPGQTGFWRQILTQLPTTPLPPPGVLPHPSRYVSLSGFSRSGHPPSTSAVWLRPVLVA